MKDLIEKHLHEGFRYKEIIALLKNCHGIKVSLCALYRFLRRVNSYSKGKQSVLLDIVAFIQHELESSGSCTGYRAMHQRCIKNGLMVSRVIVAQIMKHHDPIVNSRRRGTLRRRFFLQPGSKLGLVFGWIWQVEALWLWNTWLHAWMDIAGMFYGYVL